GLSGDQAQRGIGGAGDIGSIERPLVTQRLRASHRETEADIPSGRYGLALGLLGDRRSDRREALACTAGVVNGLYLSGGQCRVVYCRFIYQSVKQGAIVVVVPDAQIAGRGVDRDSAD